MVLLIQRRYNFICHANENIQPLKIFAFKQFRIFLNTFLMFHYLSKIKKVVKRVFFPRIF